MPAEEPTIDQPSRRAFLRTAGAGVAGGSAVLLTACGTTAKSKPKLLSGSRTARHADIALLNGLLELERTAIVAYTAGSALLSGRARAAATQFLGQELSHAGKLISVIRGAGGRPGPPPPSSDRGTPDSEDAVIDTLRTVEAALMNGYLDAIPKLSHGWLRSIAAGIFANEAEHVSVLRILQGQPPVPFAFVTASGP